MNEEVRPAGGITPEELLPGEVHVGQDWFAVRFKNGHTIAVHAGPPWSASEIKIKEAQLSLGNRKLTVFRWDAEQNTEETIALATPDELALLLLDTSRAPSQGMRPRRNFLARRRERGVPHAR